jgi:hypothetical protein
MERWTPAVFRSFRHDDQDQLVMVFCEYEPVTAIA